jgi:hypothetical protein
VVHDAVFLPTVETQRVEATLELGDIVAPERGFTEVEEAASERAARVDKRGPGVRADDVTALSVSSPNWPRSSSSWPGARKPAETSRACMSLTSRPEEPFLKSFTRPPDCYGRRHIDN